MLDVVWLTVLVPCSDELRDDDIALKLNSIRRLGTIALALGDARTREELLPYLLESKPEEDEIMVALAEEIGKLVPSVGGPEHAHCLVPLLEDLAREDETVVREAAVKSLQIVGKEFNDEQAMSHLVPCIKVGTRLPPSSSVLLFQAPGAVLLVTSGASQSVQWSCSGCGRRSGSQPASPSAASSLSPTRTVTWKLRTRCARCTRSL